MRSYAGLRSIKARALSCRDSCWELLRLRFIGGALLPQRNEAMQYGEDRMAEQEAGTRVAHDLLHISAVILGVAVHLACAAEGLGLHKWAFIGSVQRILLKFAACRAEFLPLGVMVAVAVDADHHAQALLFHLAACLRV